MYRILNRRLAAAATLAVMAGMVAPPMASAQFELSLCRGPGFWQSHAGSEKDAPNITQALIDEVGCLEICGEVVETTATNDADSALEGLCVSPKSSAGIQFARELLAAALSCIADSGDPNCLEGSLYCNEACADGVSDADDPLCRAYLSCTTKGGLFGFDGFSCQLGNCSISDAACGSGLAACPIGETCVPFADSCAAAPLVNAGLGIDFDPEPPASSSKACNTANKSTCTIVGPKEGACGAGNESGDPEVCEPECPDSECGFIPSCNVGNDCYQIQTPEETCSACVINIPCGEAAPCTASSDCTVGEACIINSCCGASGVCAPTCVPD